MFVLTHKKMCYKNDVYESLQCKYIKIRILRRILVYHANNKRCVMSIFSYVLLDYRSRKFTFPKNHVMLKRYRVGMRG
jgi:hypothetical protein